MGYEPSLLIREWSDYRWRVMGGYDKAYFWPGGPASDQLMGEGKTILGLHVDNSSNLQVNIFPGLTISNNPRYIIPSGWVKAFPVSPVQLLSLQFAPPSVGNSNGQITVFVSDSPLVAASAPTLQVGTSLAGANGYVDTFGVRSQWGVVNNVPLDGSLPVTVNFPAAYSNGPFTIVASPYDGAAPSGLGLSVHCFDLTNISFKLIVYGGAPGAIGIIHWESRGY